VGATEPREALFWNGQMSKVNVLPEQNHGQHGGLAPGAAEHMHPVTSDGGGGVGSSPTQVMHPGWTTDSFGAKTTAALDKLERTSLPNFLPRGFTVKCLSSSHQRAAML
jgi:hypothetical protein